jgi:hypothetical protein
MTTAALLDDDSIKVVTKYDKVVDLAHSEYYIVNKSGLYTTYQPVVTTNWSNSQITFNANINNTSTIISPYVLLSVPMTTTFTGTAVTGNLLNPGNGTIALRNFPLTQCTQSISLQLNTSTFTAQPSLYCQALLHHNLYVKEIDMDLSSTPSLPDVSWQYSDTFGAITSPLNEYASSNYWQNGRGCFPYTITANSPTSATVTWTAFEPIMLPPFCMSPTEARGFVGVTQFNLQLQLGNLNRMWSSDAVNGNGITGYATTVASNPTMLLRTVQPDTVMYKIPNEVKYPYQNIQVYQTQGTSTASGAPFSITSNSITLQQIPSKIFIYARRQDQDYQNPTLGPTYSDGFAIFGNPLTGLGSGSPINILFNNVQGLLSSATPVDLWRLSRRNGMCIDWNAWSGRNPYATGAQPTQTTLGSVLCLDVAKDFGLPSDLAAGTYGEQYNFSAICNMFNPANAAVTFTLFVVFVFDGCVTLTPGSSYQQLGLLSRKEVLNAPILDERPYDAKNTVFTNDGGPIHDEVGSGLVVGGRRVTRKHLRR